MQPKENFQKKYITINDKGLRKGKKSKTCKYYKSDHVFNQVENKTWGFVLRCQCGKIGEYCTEGRHCDIKTKRICFNWYTDPCNHK